MLKRHLLRPWGAALLLLLGLVLSQPRSVFADARQWQHGGIIVRQGHHIEWQRSSYRNSDGFTLVCWSDTRTGDRDVFAQLIGPDGDDLWESTGQPVVTYPYRQEDPDVAAVDGGWVIAWIEFRNDSTGDVWAQKLNSQGVPLWDPAGVMVDEFPSVVNELSLRCVNDGQGGAIVAWEDSRRGDPGDIYAQRITANGTRAWQSPLAVTDIIGDQIGITADADGQGNMILAWNDKRVSTNQDIYAAKITPQGTLPWGGVNGRLVCGAIGEQGGVKICPDGGGGAYISWQDRSSSGGASNNLNLMHFNANGDPFDANWPTDCGVVLCNAPEDQFGVRISTSYSSGSPDGCIAVWEDVRVNGAINEIYAQKISPAAQMMWGANGLKIIGNATAQGTGNTRDGVRLTSDLAGGLICAWEDTRVSEWIACDLYAQRVLANGTLSWQTDGVLISAGPGQQFAPLLRADLSGSKTLIVWDDTRQGSQRINYQHLLNTDGSHVLPDPDGVEIVYGLDGDCRNPLAIDMTMGRVAMVWSDNRLVAGGTMLYYQIVDTLAQTQFEQNGTPIAPINETANQANQTAHHVCDDGNAGFFVSFQDQRSGIQLIRAQHVNNQGFITGDSAGVLVWNSSSDQSNAFITYDGAGGCYVAWSGFDANFLIDIYVMRLGPNLNPLWAQPVRLTNTSDDDIMYGLVSNPDGCCIAVWRSGSFGEFNISTARVCQDGAVSWNRDVCDANGVQEQPTIVADGQGGAYYAWSDERDVNNNRDVYAQRVNSAGADAWGANGTAVYTGANIQSQPAVTRDSNGNLYVVWEDFRSGIHLDLYAQKLNASGARQWPVSGKVICNVIGDQDEQTPLMEWGEGIYVLWTDNRGYFPDLFGTHINAAGNIANSYWTADSGGVVCDAYQVQSRASAAPDGHGGGIVAWEDQRASGKEPLVNIWAQWINDYTVSVDEIPNIAVPETHKLEQNYPNPFNPSTQIVFAIPQTEKVELLVYNSVGQQVAKLVDKVMTAGTYRVDFMSSRIASGQYFYELRTPNFKEVKKMTLLK